MAGFENLLPIIYHERQQPGSMLCAQHALNNLLQGNYFTAPDLSEIARSLDVLEHSYDSNHIGSTNMDDTGFFSVQVLEKALTVWGLNLSRWRGEDMKLHQDHPHTQLAFILNLEQHWFTLRRFGHAEPDIGNDLGSGHWFNLNSFFPEPAWVGKLYLGMVLQQAETEGYSVFVVNQTDPTTPLALPRTAADEIASTLPPATSSDHPSIRSFSYRPPMINPASTESDPVQSKHFEDEDYDLQAALQASMASERDFGHYEASIPPPIAQTFTAPVETEMLNHSATDARATPEGDSPPSSSLSIPLARGGELDPIATSAARNRLFLENMKTQQEFAQRELWGHISSDANTTAAETRRVEWQKQNEEEAAQLLHAIEESEALARIEGHATHDDDEDLDSADMDVDQMLPTRQRSLSYLGYTVGDRVYDDDDTELQAALKASLEHVPEGWEFPELSSQRPPISSMSRVAHPQPLPHTEALQIETKADADDTEFVPSTETEEHPPSDIAAEAVSVDELRRRRLAKFGA